jgi:hypothetical protein
VKNKNTPFNPASKSVKKSGSSEKKVFSFAQIKKSKFLKFGLFYCLLDGQNYLLKYSLTFSLGTISSLNI